MREIQDIHLPLIAWLNKEGIPFHRNRPDKKTTAVKGDPDFLLTLAGRCLYIECKIPGGKPTAIQEERIAYLRKAGNSVRIVYSFGEAVLAIQAWLGIIPADTAPLGDEHQPHKNEVLRPVEHAGTTVDGSSPFRIGNWQGKEFVFAQDLDGGWNMIRQATPTDLLNFERLK